MFERLSAMLIKEFLQIRRDRWAMLRLIVPLVIQMMVFGYAATFTVHNVSTVVLDLDQSQASRSLISHFVASGRFDVVEVARTDAQVTRDIDQNVALMAIVIHAGFQRDLQNGKGAPLQVIVDGTNSNTALIALGYISQIVTQFSSRRSQQTAARRMPALRDPKLASRCRTQPWFNAGLEDRWFFIPGVIGTPDLAAGGEPDRFRDRARTRGRHARTDHGQPDPADRIHPRQDRAVLSHRAGRHHPGQHDSASSGSRFRLSAIPW